MKPPKCVNCQVPLFLRAFLCVDCVRMIVATIVGELVAAAIVGGAVWLMN